MSPHPPRRAAIRRFQTILELPHKMLLPARLHGAPEFFGYTRLRRRPDDCPHKAGWNRRSRDQRHLAPATLGAGPRKKAVQRSSVSSIQKGDESLQTQSLLPEVSGGPDQLLELVQGHVPQSFYAKHFRGAKICHRLLDVCPCRVLREISADNHFEFGPRRPPVLRTPSFKERAVVIPDLIFSRVVEQVSCPRA